MMCPFNGTLFDDVSPHLRPAGQSSPARIAAGEPTIIPRRTCNEIRNFYRRGGSVECRLCVCWRWSPVPQGSQTGEPSGRPSAVLDNAQCQSVWKLASPEGETLAGEKAEPYVVNFQMVDTDKDGKISSAEFTTGCGKGWIQSADASTTKEMTPSPKL